MILWVKWKIHSKIIKWKVSKVDKYYDRLPKIKIKNITSIQLNQIFLIFQKLTKNRLGHKNPNRWGNNLKIN